MYSMRYGFLITCIAALKMAFKQQKPWAFIHCLGGYLKAQSEPLSYLVSEEEGQFIRKLRWKNIGAKLLKTAH